MEHAPALIRVGDPVVFLPNALFPNDPVRVGIVKEVGRYPSMWLPAGMTRVGIVVTLEDFDTSPLLPEQFTWNTQDNCWHCQLF